MPSDLQFIDANINNYQDIPSNLYPVLGSVSLSGVTVNHQTTPVISGIISDGTGVYIKWNYPVTDNLYLRVAVGYQFQVIEGTFTSAEAQAQIASGTVVFEQISNLKDNPTPEDRYINLQGGASGRVDIPTNVLKGGLKYTVRVRALVFSELGLGTVSGQYFKYTKWGTVNFRVNSIPAAANLRVNGVLNPTALPQSDDVSFSFTFADLDGPSYLYRIQVGTTPGGGFSANIWDSGLISAGAGFGPRDFTVSYSGPELATGVLYAWRVSVNDGLSDGGFTGANDTFQINRQPTISSIKIDGNELIYGSFPTVASTGAVLTWTFFDFEAETQRAYNIKIDQVISTNAQGFEILNTGNVFSSASALALPDLPDGGTIRVTIAVRDSVEFGEPVVVTFLADARPETQDLRIDGRINPGDVFTTTPLITWSFFDSNAGETQSAFRIQVATNDTFATLLWDTGIVTSGSSSVIYGSTASPIVSPAALSHGSYYYIRIQVSDGISFSEYASGFFAVNTAPNSPTILTPSAGAFSGAINITWMPASPLDDDGDEVTYTLEITTRRSSNQGWEYLAGPFTSATTSFSLDTSEIKAGNDFGVRVLANDGFTDSVPALGTSPINSSGLGFTILNHVPSTPIFISPTADEIVASVLKVEWLESSPVDVDGDAVFYILEITRDASAASPVYEKIGVFNEGTPRTFVDISSYDDGPSYRMRITAQDDKGGIGAVNYSETFSIVNTPAITDFETLGTSLYMATTDGRVFRARESIWQVEEEFNSSDSLDIFEQFERGHPKVEAASGVLSIDSPPGATYILRIGPKK